MCRLWRRLGMINRVLGPEQGKRLKRPRAAGIPGITADVLVPVLDQGLPEGMVCQNPGKFYQDILLIGRVKQSLGNTDHLWQAAGIRGDDWRATGHGLKDRQAKAFMQRRENIGMAGVVEQTKICV